MFPVHGIWCAYFSRRIVLKLGGPLYVRALCSSLTICVVWVVMWSCRLEQNRKYECDLIIFNHYGQRLICWNKFFSTSKKKVWSSTKRHAFRCSSGGVLVEKKGRLTKRKQLSSYPEDSFSLSVWTRCFFTLLLRSQQYKSKFNSNAASTAVKYVWHHLISETHISVLVRWRWKKKRITRASFKTKVVLSWRFRRDVRVGALLFHTASSPHGAESNSIRTSHEKKKKS